MGLDYWPQDICSIPNRQDRAFQRSRPGPPQRIVPLCQIVSTQSFQICRFHYEVSLWVRRGEVSQQQQKTRDLESARESQSSLTTNIT